MTLLILLLGIIQTNEDLWLFESPFWSDLWRKDLPEKWQPHIANKCPQTLANPLQSSLKLAQHLWFSKDLLPHARGQVSWAAASHSPYVQSSILPYLGNCWLTGDTIHWQRHLPQHLSSGKATRHSRNVCVELPYLLSWGGMNQSWKVQYVEASPNSHDVWAWVTQPGDSARVPPGRPGSAKHAGKSVDKSSPSDTAGSRPFWGSFWNADISSWSVIWLAEQGFEAAQKRQLSACTVTAVSLWKGDRLHNSRCRQGKDFSSMYI